MRATHYFMIILLFCLTQLCLAQKKVGVVLSGGGASGMAHVGVLKALEENNIPIDYITGTSIGALVGGLYASGYSPMQIEQMVSDPKFADAANGIISNKESFYFKMSEPNASIFSWTFNLDSTFEANIPTSFVNPSAIDFGLVSYLTSSNTLAKGDFNQLFVPFRCVASNITDRKEEVFRNGNLAAAIRASMTYPFYLTPIEIDGKLMFDGGLYNNFPVNVLCEEFSPDYIIASNVSSSIDDPSEDNLVSQVKSMLIKDRILELPCAEGIIIESEVNDISTFAFESNTVAIERGYNSTISRMADIKAIIPIQTIADSLSKKRIEFKTQQPLLRFKSVQLEGLHQRQSKYFVQKIQSGSGSFTLDAISKPYLGLLSDEKVKSIYPTAIFDSTTSLYDLVLRVKKEKDFRVSFGGIVATKPFSTGFFELDYKKLKSTSINLNANLYFGRFYSSVQSLARWEIPFDIPFYIEGKYTLNQFDYFNNQSTFIDVIDAPYIILNDQYADVNIGLPALNRAKLNFGARYFWQEYNYYQTENFNRGDTSDLSSFEGYSTYASYDYNTLNRKMYANKGSRVTFTLRQIHGKENTTPGSTSINKNQFKKDHNWTIVKFHGQKYLLQKKNFRAGGLLEILYSDQSRFQNYTATLLNAPVFQPIPETQTIFMPEYRAFSYLGAGIILDYAFNDNIDFRISSFMFQPYEQLNQDNLGSTRFGEEISNREFIGSFAAIYNNKLGPLALNINYYHEANEPLSVLIHFGYLIFNNNSR